MRCVSAVLGHLTTRKHGRLACGDIVVEEVEKKQCCKCRGQMIMLLILDALPIGKTGRMTMQKKLGSCRGNMGKNIGEKRKHTIKNITGRKYSVKCVKCRVKKCNWSRHLGARKHRDGIEDGGGRGDMGGQGGAGCVFYHTESY